MNKKIQEQQKKSEDLAKSIKESEESLVKKRTAAESYGPADSGPSEKSMQS